MSDKKMNAVIFGTGEYVTGWTGSQGSLSDKKESGGGGPGAL